MPDRSILPIALLLLASITGAGCESLRRLKEPAQPGYDLSVDEKIRLTLESAPAFENAAGGLYPGKELQQYVQRVGGLVAKAIPEHHPRGFPFSFKVLNSTTVNAFALPGGYIYITRGLLERLGNEDELAGLLACQVAHVTMGHFDGRFREILLVNLGLGIPIASEATSGQHDSPVFLPDETSVALNLKGFRFTPDDEAEAGTTALQYTARTGRYRPHAVPDVLEMLDALQYTHDVSSPAWGYTHPPPPQRKKELVALLEQEYPDSAGGGNPVALAPVIEGMRRAGETYLRIFERAESERKQGERMVEYGFPKSARVTLESTLKLYDRVIATAREGGFEVAAFHAGRALAYQGLFDVIGDPAFRKKAREDFDDARRMDFQNFVARLFRGYYFLKVDGFYGRAEEELLEAARLNPGTEYRGLPYLYLAALYDAPPYEGRDAEKAAHNYELYLALDPLGREAQCVMERLRELRPDSKILKLLSQA